MKELVEYLVRRLVDEPDAVAVNAVEDDGGVVYEVRVAPGDMGKVIGRAGRVANAIRTLVKSVAMKQGQKAQVEIVDPEETGHRESEVGNPA